MTAEHHAAWDYRIEVAEQLGKTHACCVTDCPQVTLVGFLACRTHWMMLRGQTRRVLVEAFRRHHSDPEIYAEAVALARRLLNECAAA